MRRPFTLLLAFAAVAAGGSGQSQPTRSWYTEMPALQIIGTSTLPRGPGQRLDDYCTSKVIAPQSPAARAAAANGWHVTGEERVGRFIAVSFVGRLEPGTSGVCLVDGGNVGLFHDASLVLIVHMARGDGAPIRQITRTSRRGRLRIWSEEHSAPLADLTVHGCSSGAVSAGVVRIAAEERWCGGIAVPNAYGRTIQSARRSILAAGWRPAPPPAADIAAVTGGRDFDFRRAGISEVETCSGTGFGLCLFNYRHPRGARLQVQTAGEGSEIVNYEVACRRR